MALPSNYGEFSPDEVKALEEDRIFLPSAVRGKRKVSATLLAPPSSKDSGYGSESGSSLSGSSVSVRYRSFNSSHDDTLDLPESAYSTAALEFIGFTNEMASEILVNWTSRPDPNQNSDDLIDYVLAHPHRLSSPLYQNYSLAQAMVALGLTQEFRDALLDPRFTMLFMTETPQYWIRDTLRINYLTLLQLQRRLNNYAKRSLAKKAKRGSLDAVFQPAASSSSKKEPPIATMTTTSDDHNLPQSYVMVQSPSPILQDHYVLYKAKAATEMEDWIKQDGTLDMEGLSSNRGCDFNWRGEAWYWTLEAETAELYRAWASRRCPYSDTWTIRIQVPKTFVDGLQQKELWYSRDWREFVWHCKKKLRPPAKFNSYWQPGGAELIKGHICTGVGTSVTRIEQNEVQAKMTENNLVMISTGKATQWTFIQFATGERLGHEIRGEIHIDITAAAICSDPAIIQKSMTE